MRLISLAKTSSTNEVAKDLAKQGDFGPLWVRADIQTQGRGRRGREWVSPTGNLFCTGLFQHQGTPRQAALLSFSAALAVHDLVSTYVTDAEITLKWPNDVLIKGAKTSGILLENGSTHGHHWIAIGIGVNLTSHPDGTEYPATHVMEHISEAGLSGPEPIMTGADAALAVLSARFDHWRKIYIETGFLPIREAWMSKAHNIPGPVRVRLAAEEFFGEAVGLGENGELQLRLEDGSIRDVHAGDIFF